MTNQQSILVVGGTGFIGGHLVQEALKQEYDVSVLSLHPQTSEGSLKGVKYISCDITFRSKLQKALQKKEFNYVVNLSGYIEHSQFRNGGDNILRVHFSGVRNLLLSLNWEKLISFVQIGSGDEYGTLGAPQNEEMREMPISPYSMGKVASTQMLQMLHRVENFPACVLRLFLVYGPGQGFKRFLPQIISACLDDKSFPVSEGKQVRDFCHVQDIARGILLAMTNPSACGEIINLASGYPISIRDVVSKVRTIIGKGSPEFAKFPYREGENMASYANIDKARDIFGWKPKINFEDGLRNTIEFYRGLGRNK